MTRKPSGHRYGTGARQGIAFGLSLLCAVSLLVVTAGPALALPPAAPTGVSATPGNASATVSWTAPVDDGGTAITSYIVTAIGSGAPAPLVTGTDAVTATVVGLTNGDSYTFTVAATNADGDGPDSLPSSGVIPAGKPAAPTSVSATPGNASVTVTWSAPAANGAAITSYEVTASSAGLVPPPVPVSLPFPTPFSALFTGLTNGTSYSFTVIATNSVGESTPAASAPVIPRTVPGPPTGVSATARNASATVRWTAPLDDGGAPITSFTVTTSTAGVVPPPVTVGGSATSASVTGLVNGTTYSFTVTAHNGPASASAPSASSDVVMPLPTVPGAPTGVAASPGNASAIITWSAPADSGGAAVTFYMVTTHGPDPLPAPVPASPSAAPAATVNGLTNGALYTFTVTATTALGESDPSAPSAAVAPGTVPGMPTGVEPTAGDGSVTVRWVAPVGSGGAPVTAYTASAHLAGVLVAALAVPGTATEATIGGLVNGTTYFLRVVATNSYGPSAPSPSVLATPAPDIPVGVAGVRSGYWMVEADGRVYRFGAAGLFGDPNAVLGTAQAVDLEPTPSGNGYWVVDDGGRVYAYGDAVSQGNVAGLLPGERATSLSATPTGAGYWIFTTRGRVVPFGDATFHGDMAAVTLNGPVRDSIPTTSGRGYFMVASDGGIFAFGDAVFAGSMGGTRLNAPVQSLVPDADGVGYWLVAADGGIFAFNAPFRGSMGAVPLNQPVTGMVRFGDGYLMVGSDGGIFSFSDRPFLGSLGASPPARPIVSVAVLPG